VKTITSLNIQMLRDRVSVPLIVAPSLVAIVAKAKCGEPAWFL
jgi:hypothetical protein